MHGDGPVAFTAAGCSDTAGRRMRRMRRRRRVVSSTLRTVEDPGQHTQQAWVVVHIQGKDRVARVTGVVNGHIAVVTAVQVPILDACVWEAHRILLAALASWICLECSCGGPGAAGVLLLLLLLQPGG